MTRLNLLLLAILIACALSVVTSQHKARKLFIELQKAQKFSQELDVEWGRLQLEQSTWAMHSRIESIASQQLSMRVPDASRIQVMPGQVSAAPQPALPGARPDKPAAAPAAAPQPATQQQSAQPQPQQ